MIHKCPTDAATQAAARRDMGQRDQLGPIVDRGEQRVQRDLAVLVVPIKTAPATPDHRRSGRQPAPRRNHDRRHDIWIAAPPAGALLPAVTVGLVVGEGGLELSLKGCWLVLMRPSRTV